MSELVGWQIKCIKCKSDMIQPEGSNSRFCKLCTHKKDKGQRERANTKRQLIRTKKLIPEYYRKDCPICERNFKTTFKNKVYCTKKCKVKAGQVEKYLERAQNKLTKCEDRIVKVNKIYELKMIKLQEQIDYFNKHEEIKRAKMEANYNRLNNAYLLKTNIK